MRERERQRMGKKGKEKKFEIEKERVDERIQIPITFCSD